MGKQEDSRLDIKRHCSGSIMRLAQYFVSFSVAYTKSSVHLDHKTPLTMFLKWALRVPVVWWYSITQLLLRISPLLSLNERERGTIKG